MLKKDDQKKLSVKEIWNLLKITGKKWIDMDPFRQSAIIAYYAIFSLPALLVIVISIASLTFGQEEVSSKVSSDIAATMGSETASQIEGMIEKAGNFKQSLWATIIGLITLFFGSVGVFDQLHKTLNHIWEVKEKSDMGFLGTLKNKLFSFGLVISIGFLLLISLVVTSLLSALSEWIRDYLPEVILWAMHVLDFIISFSIITLLFSLMYKILPDVKLGWRNVLLGAGFTSFLFLLGKFGLAMYFGKADPAGTYGAAGSIVLILLWVSYSSMIVFFGAEFTKQYTLFYGKGIQPTNAAEKIPESCPV